MIYADPSIASWRPYFPNLTYMAYMGISDARWNLASGGADEIVTPSQNQGLWPDQLCVARSLATAATRGEPQFTSPVCVQVVDANTARLIDKTALAVDYHGRAWVAVEDRGQEHPSPESARPASSASSGTKDRTYRRQRSSWRCRFRATRCLASATETRCCARTRMGRTRACRRSCSPQTRGRQPGCAISGGRP